MDHGIWVFGYGSLIWKPGFDYAERILATLPRYHRSFCMASVEHRGTRDLPGLVLALDRAEGGVCEGVGYFVPPENAAQTLAYLRERELVTDAYLEVWEDITLSDGRAVRAVTYIIDPNHWQYVGALPLPTQAEMILRATGNMGPNTEYLHNTVEALRGLSLHDPDLETLDEMVRSATASE
jgi:cation transport protein ChaC